MRNKTLTSSLSIFLTILLFALFFLPFTHANADTVSTKILVIEGHVVCFDLTGRAEGKEVCIGKFIGKVNDEVGDVILKRITNCFIPIEFREKLQEGVYVYLTKNARLDKNTEWDVVSVGYIVKAGQEFSNGVIKQAKIGDLLDTGRQVAPEPSFTQPASAQTLTNTNQNEEAIRGGEGRGAPPEPPPTPSDPPAEPTPPAPSPSPSPSEETGTFYWVDPVNGSDGNDGSNSNPWKTITYALNNVDTSISSTIYLTSGTFSASSGESFPLTMQSGVNITGQGAGSSIIDAGGTNRVLYCSGKSNITVKDLRVTNGSTSANGGGFYIANSSNITINSCTVNNCVITGASGYGVGIYIYNSSATITNSTISSNSSSANGVWGGGIMAYGDGGATTVTISGSTISNNTISGGGEIAGGGISILAQSTGTATATINNCTINSNSLSNGTGHGGGIIATPIDAGSPVTCNISDCTVNGNSSNKEGGGIQLGGIPAITLSSTIERCKIQNNTSGSIVGANGGGGIYAGEFSPTITNCLITGNSLSTAGYGSGIRIDGGSSTTITNCTINNNTEQDANSGMIYAKAGSPLTVRNCIISNSGTGYGACEANAGNIILKTCYFYRNLARHLISAGVAKITSGDINAVGTNTSNIATTTADPKFKGASDFHLSGSSPSGVTGVVNNTNVSNAPSVDLDNRTRTTPDIGCYEYITGDPPITGRIYDSVTGENISGPVTAIYNATTNAQAGVTTANPYTFNVDPGKYYIAVSKEGYAYPSQIVTSTISGDHGDIFTAQNDALTIDIPMDSDGWLSIEKTCNKQRAETGDIVTYNVKIQNKHWYKAVNDVDLADEITNGFKYIDGSAYKDRGQMTEDRIQIKNRKGIFNIGTVSANSTTNISYQVRVGSGIPEGYYKAMAYTRKSATGTRNSNESTVGIEITDNPLFTRGTIIGKVFWDIDGNGVQDKGETGIPNAKIYTEYGVMVETDKDGKYSIKDVPAGNHLLKLDTTELPDWIQLTTDNPYYVQITEGLLAKVNFGITLINADKTQINADKEQDTNKKQNFTTRIKDDLKKFFIVALAEGELRDLSTSGNIEMANKNDRYDKGLKVDGRAALYLKGKILGKYLIKMSIDSERRPYGRYNNKKLFTNLDPDKYYPVYGDASKIDYEGVDTQDIVYVIIQWDESFAKWGSFHTELPLYNRTLDGGVINYNSAGKTKFGDTRTQIKGFGAFSRQKPMHDEFVGTGGSLYYLSEDNLIEGSEKLRVEVRDRIGKITISSITLAEEKDYEIDYDTGRILLKKPLNSIQQGYSSTIISNDVLMGERVYLVVDYEYYDGNISEQGWGANASQWIGNHIRVGGTFVQEEKIETDPYQLIEGNGTIKLNKDTEINGSYSHTKQTQMGSTISYDGGITFAEQGDEYSLDKSGNAFNIDGKTTLFNNTDIYLSYSKQDPYYSVTNSISSQGSKKYIANILSRLTESLTVGIAHITQKYMENTIGEEMLGATDSHTTTASVDYVKGKWDTRLEYQHQTVSNPITNFAYFGTLPLVDNDFIAGRIGYQIFSWLHAYIRGQGTVTGEANNQGTIGADINITKDTALNIAETVGNQGDSTLIGLTTKITEDTDAYANIEVGNNIKLGRYTKNTYGQSTQLSKDSRMYVEEDYTSYRENLIQGNILGYDKKITDTLGLGATYERSNVKNRTNIINRDSGSIALTYLNPDMLKGAKAYTKLEVRNDRGTEEIRQWLTENDLLIKPYDWLTLSGRANWGWTNNEDTDTNEAQFYEVGAGFAIRPVTWDKLNVLGKYSYITDLPPGSKWDFPENMESIKNVYSIEGLYDICKYIQLAGKFSYRNMNEKVGQRDWTHSDTYLYIVRSNFHIMNSESNKSFMFRGWDLGVEYRTLANNQIEDKKAGFLVELDKDITRYIRAGVGYNFTDYDDDLRNDDNYDAHGWFVKLAGKY